MARIPDATEPKPHRREVGQYMNSAYSTFRTWLWGLYFLVTYVIWAVLEVIKLLGVCLAQICGAITTIASALAGFWHWCVGSLETSQEDLKTSLREWKAREDLIAREADKARAQM